MTTTDIVALLLTAFAAPITVVGTKVLMKVYDHFDKSATALDRANMEGEISAALGAGMDAVKRTLPDVMNNGIMSKAVRADVLREAVNYFRTRFPDRADQIIDMIKDTGATPNAAISQTLGARLTDVVPLTPLVPAAPSQPPKSS